MLAIRIDGEVRVIQGFERVMQKLGSMEQPLGDVGDMLVKEFKGNFDEEGSRLQPSEWKELAESTQRERRRLGYGPAHPILKRTGTLKEGFLKEVTRTAVRVFNPVDYFRHHQLGGGRLPQRRMISLPERVRQEVVAVFNGYIQDVIRNL